MRHTWTQLILEFPLCISNCIWEVAHKNHLISGLQRGNLTFHRGIYIFHKPLLFHNFLMYLTEKKKLICSVYAHKRPIKDFSWVFCKLQPDCPSSLQDTSIWMSLLHSTKCFLLLPKAIPLLDFRIQEWLFHSIPSSDHKQTLFINSCNIFYPPYLTLWTSSHHIYCKSNSLILLPHTLSSAIHPYTTPFDSFKTAFIRHLHHPLLNIKYRLTITNNKHQGPNIVPVLC